MVTNRPEFPVYDVVTVSTQDNLPEPFHEGPSSNWHWSADSQHFTFDEFSDLPEGVDIPFGVPIYPGPYWYDYEVETGNMTRSSIWPLQPSLSNTQFEQFEIVGFWDNGQSFVFPSPDDSKFAYVSRIGYPNAMGISDWQGHILTSAVLPSATTDLTRLSILWNETGTAVAGYNDQGIVQILSYVTNLNGVEGLSGAEGYNFDQSIAGRFLGFYETRFPVIFDVANTTDEVLLLIDDYGLNDGSNPPEETLMLWHPLDPENSIVLDDLKGTRNIKGAIFAPGDESKIVFLDDTGLYLYDRTSSAAILLTPDYNGLVFDEVRFSPNGHWMVAYSGGLHYMIDIDMIDIVDIILQSPSTRLSAFTAP